MYIGEHGEMLTIPCRVLVGTPERTTYVIRTRTFGSTRNQDPRQNASLHPTEQVKTRARCRRFKWPSKTEVGFQCYQRRTFTYATFLTFRLLYTSSVPQAESIVFGRLHLQIQDCSEATVELVGKLLKPDMINWYVLLRSAFQIVHQTFDSSKLGNFQPFSMILYIFTIFDWESNRKVTARRKKWHFWVDFVFCTALAHLMGFAYFREFWASTPKYCRTIT